MSHATIEKEVKDRRRSEAYPPVEPTGSYLVMLDGKLHPHAILGRDLETFCKYFPTSSVQISSVKVDDAATFLWRPLSPGREDSKPGETGRESFAGAVRRRMRFPTPSSARESSSAASTRNNRRLLVTGLAILGVLILVAALVNHSSDQRAVRAELVLDAIHVENGTDSEIPPAVYTLSTGVPGESYSYNIERPLPPGGAFTIKTALFSNNRQTLSDPSRVRHLTVLVPGSNSIVVPVRTTAMP